MKRETKYLIVFIIALCALTPLGLIAEGPAWGEWSSEEFKTMLGYIPKSIEEAKPLIAPFIPHYETKSINNIVSTIISAVLGVALSFGLIWSLRASKK